MINREMITAYILTYDGSLDEYGQPRTDTPTKTAIQVTRPKLYKHTPTEDIRFENVTDSCLCFDKSIKDSNELQIGDDTYLISFVNPEGRLAQLFLVKK
jgi:hypothetical protein